MSASSPPPSATPAPPTFAEALLVWIKIGLLSFGGPTGQIGLMHRELVEKRRWISDRRFLHALNFCMLLPGPEAQQLAIYTGWLLHRTAGALVAGALFVLPGALLMGIISYVYVVFGDVPVVESIFHGLKPAVLAIVAAAVIRIGQKVLHAPLMWAVSAAAFAGIFFLGLPFPAIILGALAIGIAGGRFFPQWFPAGKGKSTETAYPSGEYLIGDNSPPACARPSFAKTLGTAGLWSLVWLAPVLAALFLLGRGHLITEQGLFFARAALVTFGGAYAVLPYVAQQAVEAHAWITATQMIDGLGLAETTPGPLILVLQFVGFVGGWQDAGAGAPLAMAVMAALMTSWVTFVPGYLFILTGAPYVEHSRGNQRLQMALTAVTAAVVGVVLNLSVWFGLHVILPEGTVDIFSLALGLICFALLQKWKWDVVPIIFVGIAAGLVYGVWLGN
jgi:chromate transporter